VVENTVMNQSAARQHQEKPINALAMVVKNIAINPLVRNTFI
jgi:hypothetical protein